MKTVFAVGLLSALSLYTLASAAIPAMQDIPHSGDRIAVIVRTPYSVFGVDVTQGFSRNKDGSVDVLAILFWNPVLASKEGAAMDISRITINCQANTYIIRNDTRMDAHWHVLGTRPVIPEIVHPNPNQVASQIVTWVCSRVNTPKDDGAVTL